MRRVRDTFVSPLRTTQSFAHSMNIVRSYVRDAQRRLVHTSVRVQHRRDTPLNKDFYTDLKAQAWWELRRRFEKTHRAVTEGIAFDHDDLINLTVGHHHGVCEVGTGRALQRAQQRQRARQQKELSQPTASIA
jgi:hypothetical protein